MAFFKLLRSKRAFTLIELLIVVAIIAILAAIAVPNFLEAQTRAKVSRAKADMRSLGTAIESYIVDNNAYPDTDPANPHFGRPPLVPPIRLATPHSRASLELLSTPISYISNSRLMDPFTRGDASQQLAFFGYARFLTPTLQQDLQNVGVTGVSAAQFADLTIHAWLTQSAGPDTMNFAFEPPPQGFSNAIDDLTKETGYLGGFYYDPTNGTISVGDIIRTGKGQLN